jgi:hypothetical protein
MLPFVLQSDICISVVFDGIYYSLHNQLKVLNFDNADIYVSESKLQAVS